MKPTHQLKDGTNSDAVCYQYNDTNPVPAWVFRNFHNLGDGRLTHRNGTVVMKGNWLIVDPEAPGVAYCLTNEEFETLFRPLPQTNHG